MREHYDAPGQHLGINEILCNTGWLRPSVPSTCLRNLKHRSHQGDERGRRLWTGAPAVKIIADSNVLLRALFPDDAVQAAAFQALLFRATVIAVPVPVFVSSDGCGGVGTTITPANLLPLSKRSPTRLRSTGVWSRCAQAAISPTGPSAAQGRRPDGTVFASFDRGALARHRRYGAEAANPSELTI